MVTDSPNYGQIWDEETGEYVDFCKPPEMTFDFNDIVEEKNLTRNSSTYNHYSQQGEKISLIVTDIGKLKDDKVCLFGVDADGKGYRPRVRNGIREHHLERYRIHRFSEVEFEFTKGIGKPPFVEDYFIKEFTQSPPIKIRTLNTHEIRRVLKFNLYDSVEDIFGTELVNDRCIPEGNGKRSMGTLKPDQIHSAYLKNENGLFKGRIDFTDVNDNRYNLPITDYLFGKYCQDMHKCKRSVRNLRQDIINKLENHEVFFRLGLGHPYSPGDIPPRYHYILITSIYLLTD